MAQTTAANGASARADLGARLADIRSQLTVLDAGFADAAGPDAGQEIEREHLLKLLQSLESSLQRLEAARRSPVALSTATTETVAAARPPRLAPPPPTLRDVLPRLRPWRRLEGEEPRSGTATTLALPLRTLSLARIGAAMTAFGLMLVIFLVYEFGLTTLLYDRSQRALLSEFKQDIQTTQLDASTARVPDGRPVSILDIPKLHVHQVVVEGTTPEDLQNGPGHVRASPMPGEFGNSLLIGRRTTYGGPFHDLDQLRSGDEIDVTTGQGSFQYQVKSIRRVAAGQADVLTGNLDSRLTLVTSDPPYLAAGRLAVVAKLEGVPVAIANRPPVAVGNAELGLAGDPAGFGLALFWGLLLASAIWLTRRLRLLWPASVTYMFAVPVILGLALLVFSGLDRALPGTL